MIFENFGIRSGPFPRDVPWESQKTNFAYIYIYEKSEIDTCEKFLYTETYKVWTLVFYIENTTLRPRRARFFLRFWSKCKHSGYFHFQFNVWHSKI